jgi:CheY-like chemotaxis protein
MLCSAEFLKKCKMTLNRLNIVLADDDTDDCSFFDKALKEISIATNLTIVHDGEQLMNYLYSHSEHLPDALFLDLSMPRKNGFECLSEIKESVQLKDLLIVMFSTSFPQDRNYEENMISLLLKLGAHDYIRKSGDFAQLREVIHKTLITVEEKNSLVGK